MSKRLQVLMPDQEMAEIQRLARRERLTVGEWVRRVLREAREQKPRHDPESKLKAIRRGAEFSFPTADIEDMLREIERGYQA
jgi:Ribbon-helix-helix protein, copG family